METTEKTVFLVDDEPVVLKALSRVLRAAGLKTAAFKSAVEFMEKRDATAPGCLVLDMTMPGVSGIQLQQVLAEKGDAPPIIFLTGRANIPSTVIAMKQGAVDFLTKPVDDADLIEAIQLAFEKDTKVRRERTELATLRARAGTLTPREREVMFQVAEGELNKQVAADLGISEKTIKVHRARVMEKMEAESLADLVRMVERLRHST